VLNELAVKAMNFETPQQAVGEVIYAEDGKGVTVLGVMKDYHWEPMMNAIEPLLLRIIPDQYNFAYFKIAGNPAELAEKIEARWAELDPAREFAGGFLTKEMDMFYQFFYDLGKILTLVGFLAITITGLGFLGMVSFDLQSRIKEIGIRKVLGASFNSLLLSMSRGFLVMLLITSVIAYPIAIMANNLWISRMASHAAITWKNVAPAVVIVLLIAAVTVISQVWKNATNNPVDSLRSE